MIFAPSVFRNHAHRNFGSKKGCGNMVVQASHICCIFNLPRVNISQFDFNALKDQGMSFCGKKMTVL